MKRIQTLLLAMSALLGSIAASAEPVSPLPACHEDVNVSAGVSNDEAATLEQAAMQYPLTLEFVVNAKPRAEIPADVQISVKDKHNRDVLTTVADAPSMSVKLPPGEYQISATYEGATERRFVKVGKADHHRLVFQWSADRVSNQQPPVGTVSADLIAIHARSRHFAWPGAISFIDR